MSCNVCVIYVETPSPRIADGEKVRPRIRSNSAESWESTGASNLLSTVRHHWFQRQDDTERNRDTNGNDDSVYGDPTDIGDRNEKVVEKGIRRQQQDGYAQMIKTESGLFFVCKLHYHLVLNN